MNAKLGNKTIPSGANSMTGIGRLNARRSWLNCAALLIALSLCGPHAASAESQQELLLFTSVDTFDTFSESDPSDVDSFVRGTADLLYSYSGERFRFLGEYLWSSQESEMERLKAGWQLSDNTMLWFGRFHATAKYWTSEYHHGQFLQTSITRPSLEEWEDESGPIPSHITGLLIEHSDERGDDASLDYAISVGLAPIFSDRELVAFDVLDPGSGHGGSVSFRIGYRPDIFSPMQLGLLVGYNDINVESDSNPNLTNLNEIRQATIGAFADWRWGDWRVIFNFTHVQNDLRFVSETEDDTFQLAYFQFEYEASKDWTIFGRTDNSFSEDNSPYLALLPDFIAHRQMLGVRWDFADLHSLTMEISDTSTQGLGPFHGNFNEIRCQWSAVFQ